MVSQVLMTLSTAMLNSIGDTSLPYVVPLVAGKVRPVEAVLTRANLLEFP